MSTKAYLLDIDQRVMEADTDSASQRIVELAARGYGITVQQMEYLLSDARLDYSDNYIENALKKFQAK